MEEMRACGFGYRARRSVENRREVWAPRAHEHSQSQGTDQTHLPDGPPCEELKARDGMGHSLVTLSRRGGCGFTRGLWIIGARQERAFVSNVRHSGRAATQAGGARAGDLRSILGSQHVSITCGPCPICRLCGNCVRKICAWNAGYAAVRAPKMGMTWPRGYAA